MTAIQKNLARIKKQIHDYETVYARPSHSVFLLAVSKGQSIQKLEQAVLAGQRAFGENYLQEAQPKIAALMDKNLEWHFIGSIQRNKIKKIAESFSWAHSVSEAHIAQRLNDQRPAYLPPLNICLEVKLSRDDTKSGVLIQDVWSLAELCQSLSNLKLRGLMTVPPIEHDFLKQRRNFSQLRELYQELNQKKFKLDTLSMGMSGDMEAAIAEGSTLVRIGTAIFGPRI